MSPGRVVVLYGPKAAGKSWVAQQLERRAGVHHVDADRLVLQLLARGESADPALGWLDPVEQAVLAAAVDYAQVSVEATGAWPSDWELSRRLGSAGQRVLRVWVTAPLAVTLERLASRPAGKVPATRAEARRLYSEATRRAAQEALDLVLDTDGQPNEAVVDPLLRLLSDAR
jgi:shikimate kinase